MINFKSVQYSLILFAFYFMSLGCYAKVPILNLYEDDICQRSFNELPDDVCRDFRKCSYFEQAFKKGKRPAICSFKNKIPIICCPTDPSNNQNIPPRNDPSNNVSSNITPPNTSISNNKPTRFINNGPTKSTPSDIVPFNNTPLITGISNNGPSISRPTNIRPPIDIQPNTGPFNNPPSKNDLPDNKFMVKTYSADEMCHEYSKLIYRKTTNTYTDSFKEKKDCVDVKPIVYGGGIAEPKEFPHMVLLGYHEFVNNIWNCAGSVISKKWILTSAHCETYEGNFAQWARLGELNHNNGTFHRDYKIQRRIIHPDYNKNLGYNDIALFSLEKYIEFSAYIRPICLNTDFSMQSSLAVSIGLGMTPYGSIGNACSNEVLKVTLDILPMNYCQTTFTNNKNQLPRGIEGDSMQCIGSLRGDSFRCSGMSGEPIHIKNYNYTCMYTQIAVTSFWSDRATVDKPTFYTKVSKYIPWIEKIVWQRNQ